MKLSQSNITLLLFCYYKCHACKLLSGLFMLVFPDKGANLLVSTLKAGVGNIFLASLGQKSLITFRHIAIEVV